MKNKKRPMDLSKKTMRCDMYNQTLRDPGVYEERKYSFGREVIFFVP